MSLVALDWLLSEAERPLAPPSPDAFDSPNRRGLRLCLNERQSFREHASVDDKLYDPRSGLGIFYRWKVRDIVSLCALHKVSPKIHVSVLERIAHGTDDYSPGNLPSNAEVIFTPPPDGRSGALAEARAHAVQRVLATIPDGTLLNHVRRSLHIGRAAYVVYLASCVIGLYALGRWWTSASAHSVLDLRGDVAGALTAAGLLSAYTVATLIDRRMGGVFSGFWYPKQKDLRDGLKNARRAAALPPRQMSARRPARVG